MASNSIDLTSQRFGMLTVIGAAGCNKHGSSIWLCRCDCGVSASVTANNLKSGNTKSCGCRRGRDRRTDHIPADQYRKTRWVWEGMIRRCADPKCISFKNYGGRGIRVCDRWLSFLNFLGDMGVRPNGCSIDRIDNDKGYQPDNCRWATRHEQNNNKRNNRALTYQGRTMSVSSWARELNIPVGTITSRITRGWTDSKIIETPVNKKMRHRNHPEVK